MADTSKNVFVVHGRNGKIRDAAFTFLRSVQLRPLEWDQARQSTEQTSPFILEAIQQGIASAQAVIVLLTGDDVVRLQKSYGSESNALQPRPNVIFEAGLALATVGRERTIFLAFPPLRGLSDLDGLYYLQMDNSPQARKNLVERLKTAGCDLDDSGSEYLSTATGGDFSPAPAEHGVDANTMGRGQFTEFIVDSSLSLTPSSIMLNKELSREIRSGPFIDLKYHYLGAACASNWIELCRHPNYGHAQLKNFIDDSCLEIGAELAKHLNETGLPLDIVSLGPGDGSIDEAILLKFSQLKLPIDYYYCIDISFELLQHSVAELCRHPWLEKNIRIKAIYGDFTELAKLKPIYAFDETVNLFLLTGYTIGNFNEAQFLRGLREGMNDADLLLIDARLHNLHDWNGKRALSQEEKQAIIAVHAHPLNNRFSIGPLATATTIDQDITIKYDVGQQITIVPKALNVVFYCENLETRIIGSGNHFKRSRLNLAATSMYDYDELGAWFKAKGFDILWNRRTSDTGLFLLRPSR